MTLDRGRNGRIVTFYSYKGGTGRTMALANIAWIMAGQGLRVLIIDWDLESPGLHRYFHPFLEDKMLRHTPGLINLIQRYGELPLSQPLPTPDADDRFDQATRIEGFLAPVKWRFPGGGKIDLMPAGQQDEYYATVVSEFEWANFYNRLAGGKFLQALRHRLRRSYDYVLIDSRTGLSDTAGICTVVLPDCVVDGFTLSNQAIEGAFSVARSIQSARERDPIRIYPVPMRVDDYEHPKRERGLEIARARFHAIAPDDPLYWPNVEIPYRPYYAYEEILSVFAERPQQNTTLLAAYERLTSVLLDREVTVAPVEESLRKRYLAEYERGSGEDRSLVVFYTSADRLWAEWITAELTGHGPEVTMRAVDADESLEGFGSLRRMVTSADHVLVVLSASYVSAAFGAEIWHLASVGRSDHTTFHAVKIDGSRLEPHYSTAAAIDVTGLNSGDIQSALLRTADGIHQDAPRPVRDHRFVGKPRTTTNLPPSSVVFVGRAAEIERIRDYFSSGNDRPLAIVGLGGIGKTQVSLEYARRFSRDYDIVWVVQATDSQRLKEGLGELAIALGYSPSLDLDTRIRRLRDSLEERTTPPRRTLLILNNADQPDDEFLGLIPRTSADILITTRFGTWDEAAETFDIGNMRRADSIKLIRRRVPRISLSEADEVAERMGDLPLAVAQAAAYLHTVAVPVPEYLQSLHSQDRILGLLEDQRFGGAGDVLDAWIVSLDRLREERPAAAWLLELCAAMGPSPIGMSIILGQELGGHLTAFDGALADIDEQRLLLDDISRYALAQVDAARTAVIIHPLVRLRIQAQVHDLEQLRDIARSVLARVGSQLSPEDPGTWPRFSEILTHARDLDIIDSQAESMRVLVVSLVRYLYRRGDYHASQALANAALGAWRETADNDDPLTLRTRFHLANAVRARGDITLAHSIDKDVYRRQLAAFGPSHRDTLATARSLGFDLRATGQYAESVSLDRRTLDLYRAAYGQEHPDTLIAVNNLAIGLRLVGDFASAAELNDQTLELRSRIFGTEDAGTLTAAGNYGRDLRDLGYLWESYSLLHRTLQAQQLSPGGDHLDTLRTGKELALTLRQLGRFADAHELVRQTTARYATVTGRNHPDALSCELAAVTIQSAIGENRDAVTAAKRLWQFADQVYGPVAHLTLACRSTYAILLLKEESFTSAFDAAAAVHEHLTRDLGPGHPHVLFAGVNLANAHFALGDLEAAKELDRFAYVELTRTLGSRHPDALAAALSFAADRLALGEVDAGKQQHTDALRLLIEVLGGTHPRVEQAIRGERLNVYIEPAPL
ncbi:FxSxx-COOH system tetratricopeptide repeat protein [Catellatospora aurea]|uniref:FxSxx-COOH system tetratricopeptide repeat protein n=1 Tax=Catellatospora aurea TaxID=1337874 RepID=A0ABW2GVS1_9ACTN